MDISEYIVHDPEVCGGQPAFRGTDILVRTVLLRLAYGDDEATVLAAFPMLTRKHLRAALSFAAGFGDDGAPCPAA